LLLHELELDRYVQTTTDPAPIIVLRFSTPVTGAAEAARPAP
jgi:hypothetical protein